MRRQLKDWLIEKGRQNPEDAARLCCLEPSRENSTIIGEGLKLDHRSGWGDSWTNIYAGIWLEKKRERLQHSILVEKGDNERWETLAQKKIDYVKSLLPEGLIIDALHVGSTSIPNIRNRGSITINFAVTSLREFKKHISLLVNERAFVDIYTDEEILVSVDGDYEEICLNCTGYQLYFITKLNRQWVMKRDFRDYMRNHPEDAKRYEAKKIELSEVVKSEWSELEKLTKDELEAIMEIQRDNGHTNSYTSWGLKAYEESLRFKLTSQVGMGKYGCAKAAFVLEILRKCGHKYLYLSGHHERGVGDGCIGGNPSHILTSFYGITEYELKN